MATNPLPSTQEPAVDRDRRWSPVWYRWLKPLLETVNETSAVISETKDIVDGLSAKWTVAVNLDNKVVGLVQLAGTGAESTFTVLADKFIVRRPGSTEDIQAFIIGAVNGTTTVGINGNLVVDGTILARHLEVDSLSAINADIGTCTAGKIQSSDGKFVIDLDNKVFQITT